MLDSLKNWIYDFKPSLRLFEREIEKFITRQPPKGEKDDYDSENSWISDGLPSSFESRIQQLEKPM